MGRTEYTGDPDAPDPNSLVIAASAVVVDGRGRLLLQQRADNQLWSIPGGEMEVGESVSECVTREVREETGYEAEPLYVVGVYSDPKNVVAYDNGEVRQRFSICVACDLVGGKADLDGESLEARLVDPEEIAGLEMSPAIQLRIDDYLANRQAVLR